MALGVNACAWCAVLRSWCTLARLTVIPPPQLRILYSLQERHPWPGSTRWCTRGPRFTVWGVLVTRHRTIVPFARSSGQDLNVLRARRLLSLKLATSFSGVRRKSLRGKPIVLGTTFSTGLSIARIPRCLSTLLSDACRHPDARQRQVTVVVPQGI